MISAVTGDRTQLRAEANVVRYVGGSHVDTNSGIVNGSAFDRGPKDGDGLSFTQVGFLATERLEDEAKIRTVVGSRVKLGKSGCFAEVNVGVTLSALSEFEATFSFVQDPLPADGTALANPAHALLLGLPFKGEAVGSLNSELAGDLIALKILRTFPAVAPK